MRPDQSLKAMPNSPLVSCTQRRLDFVWLCKPDAVHQTKYPGEARRRSPLVNRAQGQRRFLWPVHKLPRLEYPPG